MKKRRIHVSLKISTILLCILVILLCAPSHSQADDYDDGGIWYIYGGEDFITVSNGTTVNLYASVTTYVSVGPDSFLNIHSGNVNDYITVNSSAVVTVYGKSFTVSNGAIDPDGKWLPTGGSGTLTVTYDNNTTYDLDFVTAPATSITLVNTAGPEQVSIDIKPGSNPNSINPGSNGLVPVAILSSAVFDATQVDPTSVSLAGARVAVRGKGKFMAHEEDVNGDGLVDLVVQVETQGFDDLGVGGTVELTGITFGGEDIVGYDEVVIVPPDK